MSYLNNPLPHNEDAERALIGSCVLFPDTSVAEIIKRVKPEDLYHPLYRMVLKAIIKLHNRGKRIDPITIKQRLLKMGAHVDTYGGAHAITQTTVGLPRLLTEDIIEYCETVKRDAVHRNLIHLCNQTIHHATDPNYSIEEIMEEFEPRMLELNTHLLDDGSHRERQGFRNVGDVADEMRDRFIGYHDGTIKGVGSGFPELDKQLDTGGFQDGGLYLLSAVEKAGKTSLLLDWAMNIEKQGYTVPVITLEMSALTMTQRLFSKYSGVPYYKFRPGFHGKDYETAMGEIDGFSDLNIQITDNLFGLSEIERHLTQACEFAERKGKPVKVAIIDYLQLIVVEGHTGNREQEVAKISRTLKRLASKLGIAIIVVSTMNRTDWGEGPPTTRNLRDSHQLAYDAEAVFFLWDHNFKPGQPPEKKKPIKPITFIIGRQRNGPEDTIPLKFVSKMMMFMTESQFRDHFGSEYDAEEEGFNRKVEQKETRPQKRLLAPDEFEDDDE